LTVLPDDRDFTAHLLVGIGLFNRACFFEAHEVLEEVWRSMAPHQASRRHLQGLVQLAVAFHHESTGNYAGARSVLERALRNIAGADNSFHNLDFDRLRAELQEWQEYLAGRTSRPKLPKITTREPMA
jgi:predicted metal-dependent hydrolase